MGHLKKIKIENLALLEKGELFFDKGLNVITGETGAGKSIIVIALSMILGERADKEYIKHGAKFASIEAEFDINEPKPLVIYREFSKEGSSKIKINSKTVTLNKLKKTTSPIAEISGQYAGQELMDENNHLNFLDSFGSLESIRDKVSEHYFSWKKTTEELKKILNNKEQLENERKLLLFQKNEIENAHIEIGEEEKINSELKKLNSARELMSSASAILDTLGGEDKSVLELIAQSQKELEKMFAIDKKLDSSIELLNEINFQLEDIRSSIEQYGSSIVDNPERMEEINLRLDEIYILKKKYGGSEEAILKSYDIISDKLTNHPETQGMIDDLTEQRQIRFDEYSKEALKLSKLRRKNAQILQRIIIKELKNLAIENGGFEFEFIYEDDPQGVIINERAVKPFPHGLENGKILFSANPGEPLKSLVKTASGGEISRVLLAIKSAEAKQSNLKKPLLVFDEVDAGIGGQTAMEVGKKLKQLSENCQLIVITHLHQIARMADHHFVAEKTDNKKKAIINLKKLNKSEISKELDRMIALPVD